MKSLAILLLLANVVIYAWQYDQGIKQVARTARQPPSLPADTPTLSLLTELDEMPPLRLPDIAPPAPPAETPPAPAGTPAPGTATPAVAAATSPPAPAAEPPPPTVKEVSGSGTPSDVCIKVGPFARDVDYAGLEAWLRQRATHLQDVIETVRKRQLFWVYLEPKTASEARHNIADLERKGVRDYLLIKRGGLTNAISLGLFSSQDSVNRRLAEMTKQGYKPVVVPRYETTDLHWLRANLASGYADPKAVPAEVLGNATVKPINCTELEILVGAAAPPR